MYTPANLDVFNAAFFGSQAGMVNYLRANTSSSASTFTTITAAAGAIAQELDTLRGAGATDDYELGLIASASIGVVATAANLNATPSVYQSIAQSILAVVTSGENYLASQGITPPSPGFGPVSGPATSTVGAVSLWADSVGSNLANSTVIVTSGAGKTTMQLGAPDASYVGLQSLSGTSSYTLAFPTAQPSANSVLVASAVVGGVSTLTWDSSPSTTLAGDVTGPADANTLVAITGAGGNVPIAATANRFTWSASSPSPGHGQTQAASGAGVSRIERSQAAATGSAAFGGTFDFAIGKPDTPAANASEFWFGCETVAGGAYLKTLGLSPPTSLNGGLQWRISDNSGYAVLYQTACSSGTGGSIEFDAQAAGTAASTAGFIYLNGGDGNDLADGGSIWLTPGRATGSGTDGIVLVNNGKLELQSDGTNSFTLIDLVSTPITANMVAGQIDFQMINNSATSLAKWSVSTIGSGSGSGDNFGGIVELDVKYDNDTSTTPFYFQQQTFSIGTTQPLLLATFNNTIAVHSPYISTAEFVSTDAPTNGGQMGKIFFGNNSSPGLGYTPFSVLAGNTYQYTGDAQYGTWVHFESTISYSASGLTTNKMTFDSYGNLTLTNGALNTTFAPLPAVWPAPNGISSAPRYVSLYGDGTTAQACGVFQGVNIKNPSVAGDLSVRIEGFNQSNSASVASGAINFELSGAGPSGSFGSSMVVQTKINGGSSYNLLTFDEASNLTLSGASSIVQSAGQALTIQVATTASSGSGNDLSLLAQAAATPATEAGSLSLSAGSGTNCDGGDALLLAGDVTGTGSAGDVIVRAGDNTVLPGSIYLQNPDASQALTVDSQYINLINLVRGSVSGSPVCWGVTTNPGSVTTGTYALSSAERANPIIYIAIALTGDVTYKLPGIEGAIYWVYNVSTGGHAVEVVSDSGVSPVVIPSTVFTAVVYLGGVYTALYPL